MQAHEGTFSVSAMCRVLEVSTSGYYSWLNRNPSKRDQEDEMLTEKIRAVHKQSKGTYGAPRIHAELRHEGSGAKAIGADISTPEGCEALIAESAEAPIPRALCSPWRARASEPESCDFDHGPAASPLATLPDRVLLRLS